MIELKNETEDSISNNVACHWREIVDSESLRWRSVSSFTSQSDLANSWLIKEPHQVEQCTLTASRLSHDRKELATMGVHFDTAQNRDSVLSLHVNLFDSDGGQMSCGSVVCRRLWKGRHDSFPFAIKDCSQLSRDMRCGRRTSSGWE